MKDKQTNTYKDHYQTNPIRCKGRGKEGSVRKLVFNDTVKDAIQQWIDFRGEDDCEYVFVKKNQKTGETVPLSPSAFNYWFSNIFSQKVGRRVHPHELRATRATHLVVYDNKDIKTAQAALGHKSSETTEIYVIRDDSNDVDDAF